MKPATPATFEIIVSPTGQTQVQTHGFTGAACQHASRFLEAALGKTINEQLTTDFYQAAAHQQNSQRE